ncbi:MAG: hypothetical protein DRJ01_18805, partial [Bacteroidetes bacterium]
HAPDYCMPMQIPNLKKHIRELEIEFKNKKMPVNGKDIINFFHIKTGINVGKLLSIAENLWFEHPSWDKEKILSELKQIKF